MSTVEKCVSGTGPYRERTSDKRDAGSAGPNAVGRAKIEPLDAAPPPAAGAHAAGHLVNEDLTPGAGALPSHAHKAGKEVDGGAG